MSPCWERKDGTEEGVVEKALFCGSIERICCSAICIWFCPDARERTVFSRWATRLRVSAGHVCNISVRCRLTHLPLRQHPPWSRSRCGSGCGLTPFRTRTECHWRRSACRSHLWLSGRSHSGSYPCGLTLGPPHQLCLSRWSTHMQRRLCSLSSLTAVPYLLQRTGCSLVLVAAARGLDPA